MFRRVEAPQLGGWITLDNSCITALRSGSLIWLNCPRSVALPFSVLWFGWAALLVGRCINWSDWPANGLDSLLLSASNFSGVGRVFIVILDKAWNSGWVFSFFRMLFCWYLIAVLHPPFSIIRHNSPFINSPTAQCGRACFGSSWITRLLILESWPAFFSIDAKIPPWAAEKGLGLVVFNSFSALSRIRCSAYLALCAKI